MKRKLRIELLIQRKSKQISSFCFVCFFALFYLEIRFKNEKFSSQRFCINPNVLIRCLLIDLRATIWRIHEIFISPFFSAAFLHWISVSVFRIHIIRNVFHFRRNELCVTANNISNSQLNNRNKLKRIKTKRRCWSEKKEKRLSAERDKINLKS